MPYLFPYLSRVYTSCPDTTNQFSGPCVQGDNCTCFDPSNNVDCGCLPGYEVVPDLQGVSRCYGMFLKLANPELTLT